MRRTMMLILAMGGLWTMIGCTSVLSDKPIGEKPVVLDPGKWEGKWLSSGEWCTIRVLNAKQGLLEFKPPTEDPMRVTIRQSGDWVFANVSEPAKTDIGQAEGKDKVKDVAEEPKAYFWGLIKNEDNQIIFWLPDDEKFEALVASSKLPGEITPQGHDKTILLKDLKAEHLQLIMPEDEAPPFMWPCPIALVREEPAEKRDADRAVETEIAHLVLRSLGLDGDQATSKTPDGKLDEASRKRLEEWLKQRTEQVRQKDDAEARIEADLIGEISRTLKSQEAQLKEPSQAKDDAKEQTSEPVKQKNP